MSERHRVGRLFRIRRVERDVDEELRFHFERTVDELVLSGWTRDEAEREAGRRFGTDWWYRRELVRIDRGAAVRQWFADRLRGVSDIAGQVLGAVRRSPGPSVAIIAAFALGIGVNGMMFRIVDRLWLSPPAHIEAPDEIVRVLVDRFDSFSGRRHATPALSYPDYEDLLTARGFADIAASTTTRLMLGHGETAERVTAVLATGGYFRMLGVRAALGRLFDEADDVVGVTPVVVLSHGYWQRAFGGSNAVLGRTIDFGRGPYQIIGVAPRHFTGVDLGQVDVWLPVHAAGALPISDRFFTQALTGRGMLWLSAHARLAPGNAPAAAAAEATALHRAGHAEEIAGGDYDAEASVVLASLIAARGPLARPETDVALWLAIVALLVLLIACVNVANLLLARAVRQRHEIGIRLALGVPRGRLVGQLLLEGLVLGLIGGALALGLAHFAAPFLGTKLLPDVDWTSTASAAGTRALVVTAVLAALAGLLSALPPAIQAARRTVMDALRTTAAGAITRSTARTRSALVLVQAMTSVLLLVGAALFVRSLNHALNADLGFESRDLFVAFPTFERGSTTEAEQAAYFRDAPNRLERVPPITVASASATSPFQNIMGDRVDVPGRDFDNAPRDGQAHLHAVSPGYFEALGLRIVEGRAFSAQDRDGAPLVAIINRTLARAGWPEGRALGGCVELRETCLTVVGVVDDPSLSSLEPAEQFQVWMPAAQRPLASDPTDLGIIPDRLLARANGDRNTHDIADAIRRELIAMDPRVRFVEVQTMREVISTRSWELGATLFSAFGLLALVLAALGLYSVLAFDVAQRTRELGLRVALGATRPRLMRAVIMRGLRVAAIGVAVGLVLAWLLAPRLADLLFGVSPRDAVSFGGAAIVLLLVALVASALPAWTAIRADPLRALRSE